MIVKATKTAFDAEKHRALFENLQPFIGVDCLIGLAQKGSISLFEVHADDDFLGILLARVDRLYDGRPELVILHAAATVKPPMPMTSILNPLFDRIAEDHGCGSIRVHSDRKGLDRLLEVNGYKFWENVYRKEI